MDIERVLAELVARQERLEKTVDELRSKQQIAEILFRASRAVDRGDVEMLHSCFHPGGTDYRGVANGPAENLQQALAQARFDTAMHGISNISISLQGDVANVECYCLAFHHIAEANEGRGRDEHIRARYLDRFERRNGEWKIVRRITVWDWTSVVTSSESWIEALPEPVASNSYFVRGRRDKDDVVYTFALPEALRRYEPGEKL